MKNKITGKKNWLADKRGMNSRIKIIGIQLILLAAVMAAVYFAYPRINLSVQGNSIYIEPENANIIIISENPDFSNSKYINIGKNLSLTLKPGTYYWKSGNGIIEGFENKFVIESDVGLKVEKENDTELVNIGNVKINVSKTKEGVLVGHIILEPNQSEKIEDAGRYTGGQA